MKNVRFSLLVFLIAAPLFSQLTIGPGFSTNPNSSDINFGSTQTDIDLVAPASGTGSVSSVHLHWAATGCTNALKIKFFRRSGNTLTMTAERGPFSTPT